MRHAIDKKREALIYALDKARALRDGQPLIMDPVCDPDQRKCVAN